MVVAKLKKKILRRSANSATGSIVLAWWPLGGRLGISPWQLRTKYESDHEEDKSSTVIEY